ncbi:MAG: NAD(+)--rifampin ADP-ribosyltransferase [Actinobacteria bacterium]|nr:NAD(+)--rifampin ADP-ribosyltransferase [Actinomycetota bacterium]MCA1722162.1 NAD(+)--rifampin ADP-ribosyltransferase [Actinomycetota bacterium]
MPPAATLADHDHIRGPFLHGTRSLFASGDLVLPGRPSHFRRDRPLKHVYFTTRTETAAWGAELAAALAPGIDGPTTARIYEVEPLGPFEDDPNVTDKRFAGNPTRSYRSQAPLRVVAEVADWPRHSPEELQAMLASLSRLRAEGRDVVLD